MSENKENAMPVSIKTEQPDKLAKSESVEAKLGALEKNVDFLMQLGKHQDKLLKQAASEIIRLSKIVSGDDSNNVGIFNETKIYVGNLSPQATPAEMRNYFTTFGTVIDAFIVNKHTSSQCGFIEFSEKEMAQAALNARPHTMQGRRIFVDKSRGPRTRRFRAGKENSSPLNDQNNKSVKSSSKVNRYSPY